MGPFVELKKVVCFTGIILGVGHYFMNCTIGGEMIVSKVILVCFLDQIGSGRNESSGSVCLKEEQSWIEDMFTQGKTWFYIGLLQTFLLAPQGPVDPAHKQAVKLKYMQEQVCTAATS